MQPIRLLGNWLFILTSPIWVLPAFFTIAVRAAFYPEKDPETYKIITGGSWVV